jgi:hypothetical protein
VWYIKRHKIYPKQKKKKKKKQKKKKKKKKTVLCCIIPFKPVQAISTTTDFSTGKRERRWDLAYLVATGKLAPVDTSESSFPKFVVIVEVVGGSVQLSQGKYAPCPCFLAARYRPGGQPHERTPLPQA